jgi:tetratricopeptide (TPR) repeat protein
LEYYKNQNYSACIGEFQRSLKINPDNIAAFVYIGGAFVRMKKYSDAIPYLEKGKDIPIYKKFVLTNLGAAYEALDPQQGCCLCLFQSLNH